MSAKLFPNHPKLVYNVVADESIDSDIDDDSLDLYEKSYQKRLIAPPQPLLPIQNIDFAFNTAFLR
jgi:hypothetical protein